MQDVFIAAAVRTPIGAFLGSLSSLSAPRLGALSIAEAISRARIPTEKIEQVVFGQVLQAGVGQAPARQAAIYASLPSSVGAVTVHKVCGSGMRAAYTPANNSNCLPPTVSLR